MIIRVKLLENGKYPERKTNGAACYDCYAAQEGIINLRQTTIIPLGFAVEVPEGYYMEVRGRSGLSTKGILVMTGTVDSDYRGEVGAIITNLSNKRFKYSIGDRIAQVCIKKIEDTTLEGVTELSETKRGSNGFGSTGV